MNKAALFVVLVAVAVCLNVVAQNGGMPPGHQMLGDPEKFVDGHVAALDGQVHLTAAQKAQLRPVFLDEGKRLFAILNSSMSQLETQDATQKLHEQTAGKVDSLLTPQQRRQTSPQQGPHTSPSSQT